MTAVVAASWAAKHARDRAQTGPWMQSTGSNNSGGNHSSSSNHNNTNNSSSYSFSNNDARAGTRSRAMEPDNALQSAAPGIKYGEVVALSSRDSSNGQFSKGDIGQATYQEDGSVVIQWPNGSSSRTSWPNRSWYRGYPLRLHQPAQTTKSLEDVSADNPEILYGRRRSSSASSTSAGSSIIAI